MITLDHRTPLHVPTLHLFDRDGISYAVDAERPNWIAVDRSGRELLDRIPSDGSRLTLDDLVRHYAANHGMEAGKAWVHVHDFLAALDRAGMLSDAPRETEVYPGRAQLIRPEGLRELWIQINNACNLTCSHCLVSSGPGKEPGLPTEQVRTMVDRAVELGLERLYITGGEPFVRKDLPDLIRHCTEDQGVEVIVLTNGTVFKGSVRTGVGRLDRDRVSFQVSVDGARA